MIAVIRIPLCLVCIVNVAPLQMCVVSCIVMVLICYYYLIAVSFSVSSGAGAVLRLLPSL